MSMVGSEARFSNGSRVFFQWLRQKGRDAHNLGSLEVTDVFIDECVEVTEKVVDILNSRIRYKLPNDTPKLFMTCNPANNWVKWRFVKDQQGKPVKLKPYQRYVPFGLKDNPDKKFAGIYRGQLMKLSAYDRARLLDGNWDVIENANPWFHNFKYGYHTYSGYQVVRHEPIILSFDFNVSPCTCTAAQYIPSRGLYCFRSHEVNGGTEALCGELLDFGYHKNPAGVIVTGDVSGHSRKSSSNYTDYQIIVNALNLSRQDVKHVGGNNPYLSYSRRICNHALRYSGLINIEEYECSQLISDISSAMPKGLTDNLVKDENNGQHHTDNFRYLVNLCFPRGVDDVKNAAELVGATQIINTEEVSLDSNVDFDFEGLGQTFNKKKRR